MNGKSKSLLILSVCVGGGGGVTVTNVQMTGVLHS